jgi:sulfite reductase (NADPH) hemoprotein beta-component
MTYVIFVDVPVALLLLFNPTNRSQPLERRRQRIDVNEIKPNLRTAPEDYSGVEKAKLATRGLTLVIKDRTSPVNLSTQFRDLSFDDLAPAAESLAKSYGIYLEFNRAKTGSEKDWMFMLRITIPGGGPLTKKQWAVLDDISEKYTESASYTGTPRPSLRVTTRQNIQLHWIKKKNLVDTIQEIAKSGFYTINGCGDNVRNTMGCPLSHYSTIFNANLWAQKVGKYFQLPTAGYLEIFTIDPSYLRRKSEEPADEKHFHYAPNLLNRKFKIGFSAIHFDKKTQRYIMDNCVELRTNDIGVAPILVDGKVTKFQVYVGGGQGEKAGNPTFAALGEPLGIFNESELLQGLDAIVQVHQEWGDRKNRQWARMKYVIYKMGIEWFREQVRNVSGINFDPPDKNFDYGARQLHYGWTEQDHDQKLWCYGAFIETGRIIDGPNGQLKKMVRYVMDNNSNIELLTTPNQDLLFGNIPEDLKRNFEADLQKFGYGLRNGKPPSKLRTLSGACVGRDTCRLTYTDSEKFLPSLIDQLEPKWGEMAESIGITGCERQCFRPATKTIGWVGSGFNLYSLKIGGTEDGRNLGGPLIDPDTQEIYLHLVPRNQVATVTEVLFEFYLANRNAEETRPGGTGYFFKRIGTRSIINHLSNDPRTAQLMSKKVKNLLASESSRKYANPSLSS